MVPDKNKIMIKKRKNAMMLDDNKKYYVRQTNNINYTLQRHFIAFHIAQLGQIGSKK